MANTLVTKGGVIVRRGGAIVGRTRAGALATYALFSNVPSPGWVQAGAALPPMSLTLSDGPSVYVQLARFGVAVGSSVGVAVGATITGLPMLSSVGMYTIRAFADAGLTTQIGESGAISAWASASGPASAAVTIDSSSVPTQPQLNKNYTITGTAVTANNYILVSLAHDSGIAEQFCAEVVNGVWSQTRAWTQSRNYLLALDPSTGQQASSTTQFPVNQTGEFAANLFYADNGYGGPVYTTASSSTYDSGQLIASVPASWGTVTSLTINPIPSLMTISSGGAGNFIHQRSDQTVVPGYYTISAACTFSSHGAATLSLAPIFVPYSQPPTQAKLTLSGPVTDRMPAYTVIGSISNFSAAQSTRFRSSGSTFVVPLDNNYVTLDGNDLVTFQDNIPAGNYSVGIRSLEGTVTTTTMLTVAVAATTAGTISYAAPSGITNKSPPGTSLGTPTTTITGTVTWSVQTDRGYRVAINPTTAALTIARYLSACGNGVDAAGERFNLLATNGTQTAMLAVFIPVAFPIDLTCHVGSGQQYATFAAFWAAKLPNFSTAWANGNIQLFVHPGAYQNDLGVNCGRVYTNLRVTGIRGGDGKLPLITTTEPSVFADDKGYFNDRGMDLIVEGLEIAHARKNSGGNSFNYAICMDDSVGAAWIGQCELRDFILHDCDDGVGRGQSGTRSYIHHGVMAYGPDGSGYGHGIYALGGRMECRSVTFFGGSEGHAVKSRCDTNVVDSCIFAPLNNSSWGSLIDLCNGGNNTVTNNKFWLGPNSNNSRVFQVAAEAGNYGNAVALGNKNTFSGNFVYNLMPRTDQGEFYSGGHLQGIALSSLWNQASMAPYAMGPLVWDVHDNTFFGFRDDLIVETGGSTAPIPLGANNTINRLGTIPSGASYLQPANWPLLTAVPGFTDGAVGPTFRPTMDGTQVVGTQWLAASTGGAVVQEIPHTATVGTIVAYAFTAAKSFENSDQGPFTYSLVYTDSGHTGLLSVTSNGHLTVAQSLAGMAGQAMCVGVSATSAQTGAANTMLAWFPIT